MNKSIFKKFISTAVVAVVAAVMLPAVSANAWSVNHSASAVCKDNQAVVNWRFKNTEPNQAKWYIDLEVTDAQTGGKTVKTVAPGESVNGSFTSVKTKLSNGKVYFKMLWTDGRGGIDTRSSSYSSTEECFVEEKQQPAFDANVVCTVVDEKALFSLKVTQTAGDVDGIFTPANGETLPNGNPVMVLGVFNYGNSVEKLTRTTAAVADCTPEEPKLIKVCRDGKIITISEDEKKSTDTNVCPEVLSKVKELPKTGAVSILSIMGATFAGGTLFSQLRLRRKADR